MYVFHTLSATFQFNWTTYLRQLLPASLYEHAKKATFILDKDVMRQVDGLLKAADPRTLTNYIFNRYIKANILERVDEARGGRCLAKVLDANFMPHAVGAMFVRSDPRLRVWGLFLKVTKFRVRRRTPRRF